MNVYKVATLIRIDEEIYETLKELAETDNRSLNKENRIYIKKVYWRTRRRK